MSKILPMPSACDLSKNIMICHFMIKNPNISPVKKSKSEKGKSLITILNSCFLKAGFRKDKTWATKRGKETTSPLAIPQLIARLIN